MGLCHQRGNIRARKRRWEPCTSREAGVLQAEGTRQCKGPGGRGPGTSGQQGRGRTEQVVSGMRVMWSSNLWLSFLPDGHWWGRLWPPTQDGLGNKGRSREVGDKTGFRPSGHRAGAGEPGGCLWNQTRQLAGRIAAIQTTPYRHWSGIPKPAGDLGRHSLFHLSLAGRTR